MSWLIDTNVLLRFADQRSPEHEIAVAAVEHLLATNNSVFIGAQVIVEFWAVATRPEPVNGLGWSAAATADVIRALRDQFSILDETPDVLERWFELVGRCQVIGKRAHDARLASLLLVHGIQQLLTFNTSDFPPSWGVAAVHPGQLATDEHG